MCPQVCRLVPEGEGTYGGRSYMIMELLGVNLAQFRHSSPHGRILPELVKKIGTPNECLPQLKIAQHVALWTSL